MIRWCRQDYDDYPKYDMHGDYKGKLISIHFCNETQDYAVHYDGEWLMEGFCSREDAIAFLNQHLGIS